MEAHEWMAVGFAMIALATLIMCWRDMWRPGD